MPAASDTHPIHCVAIVVLFLLASMVVPCPDAGNDGFHWSCPNGDGTYTCCTLSLEIPEDIYLEAANRGIQRSPMFFLGETNILSECYIDPGDPYVRIVADHIMSTTEGRSDRIRAEATLTFVKMTIAYKTDMEQYGTRDYWATPIETLYSRHGDCEDTSILLCAILKAMDIECVLFFYPGHISVGVMIEGEQGYISCETTGNGAGHLGYVMKKYRGTEPLAIELRCICSNCIFY